MSHAPKRRIYELDLLRGFFICIIVLDHLQFWPSPLQYLTGQGRLWGSAAEGFFLISGLLIGYLRAYKGASTPLGELSKGLLKRAGMLYIWCVGITFAVVALTAILPGDGAQLPKLPEAGQVSSLGTYVLNVVTTHFATDWIYFLRLYALMLAVTPLFLWLIRIGKWYLALALTVGTYVISVATGFNEGALQWQLLFFGAGLVGWKLETILAWLRQRPRLRRGLIVGLITGALSTMTLSYFMVHGWRVVEAPGAVFSRDAYVSVRASVDPLFSNNPLLPLRVALAFLWFTGLLALFHVLRPWLLRYFGWLLLPFGQASLSIYCAQALVLMPIVTYLPVTGSFWLNGLIGVLVVLLFAGLLRIPVVRRVLPR
ncbi:MAG TPA: OpgC domain-containing protein [Candidatus Saccharimonadales bacterium]|jgi:hypothetical protein